MCSKLEQARSSQIESASLAEFGLSPRDLTRETKSIRALAPPTVGSTPVRPENNAPVSTASGNNLHGVEHLADGKSMTGRLKDGVGSIQ